MDALLLPLLPLLPLLLMVKVKVKWLRPCSSSVSWEGEAGHVDMWTCG
jgi:hypothetical protein